MSIKANAVVTDNGVDVQSMLNFLAVESDLLKSASEPIIMIGTQTSDIPTDQNDYKDVKLNFYSAHTNFTQNMIKITDDGTIKLNNPNYSPFLIISATNFTITNESDVYEKFVYKEPNSTDWVQSINTLKHAHYPIAGTFSNYNIWLFTPAKSTEFKLQFSGTNISERKRQNIFAIIGLTNSQQG